MDYEIGLNKDAEVNNGFFDIKYCEDGVYLTVYPVVKNGKKVEIQEVLDKLNRKQIRSFNKDIVEIAVFKADEQAVKIAEPQLETKLNATATVMVTPDKMKVFLSLTKPEGGRMLTISEIMELLKNNGVTCGIDNNILQSIVEHPIYNEMICIAQGTYPVNGQNGKVEFHFDTNRQYKPTILEDGRVDFRELNIIESVKKGQKLCSLISPVPGTKGENVAGTKIPAVEGKPAVLPKGKNVEITEDGQTLIAGIDGQVNYIEGKVNVFASFEVQADVDNSTGNISFVGNVVVRGSVLSGFEIEAGGSIEVWGVVEGAVLKAGGDIILRRGIQGHGKGVLISGGDIISRYIEHSNIEARNDIKAEAIMHSNVKCGNNLEVTGGKGLLVGGSCKVGKEISAKVIGSYMATSTDLDVGVDPGLRERNKAVKEEIVTLETDLKKADQAIFLLRKLETAGMLTPEKREILVKSVRTKVFFSSRINELKQELNIIEEKLQQDSLGKIKCSNCIYPGSRITIGSCKMNVRETLQNCTLYRDSADIRVGPYT